jgi:hypothetical protein
MMRSLRRRTCVVVLAGMALGTGAARATGDPPRLVPWTSIGDIRLGEPKRGVEREYGSEGHGFHVA